MIAQAVAERIVAAGLEVVETLISSLAYAPEIAQTMLQRQQASAAIEARKLIVEGVVTTHVVYLVHVRPTCELRLIRQRARPTPHG